MKFDPTVWRTPIMILAGLTAIGALIVFVSTFVRPEGPGSPIACGLAGASVTFTLARVFARGRMTRQDIELLLLAVAVVALALLRRR